MVDLSVVSQMPGLHFPEFYVSKKCCYEDGVGEVTLVFSSRFMGQESTGSISDILSDDDETAFLEGQIMGAVQFFEYTLGMFGMQKYALHNGVPFQLGDMCERVPCFLEQRILHELTPFAEVQGVYRVVGFGSDYLQ